MDVVDGGFGHTYSSCGLHKGPVLNFAPKMEGLPTYLK